MSTQLLLHETAGWHWWFSPFWFLVWVVAVVTIVRFLPWRRRYDRRVDARAILATPPAVVERASADEQARAARVVAHILPVSRRRLGLRNDARVTGSLPRYELERITAPTLVISLEDDFFGTYDGARYSAEHIPHARFVGYQSGGHLWVGHQTDVLAEIAGFLKNAA